MDYKNAQIYTIRSHQTTDIYVGSTCSPLYKRLYQHKKKYKCWIKGTNSKYYTSYEILKYDDAYIELYEDFKCSSKKELNRREGHIIRKLNCVNKVIAGRTQKEYYQDNKEKLDEIGKEWRKKNREKIKQYMKEYYEKNQEKLIQKRKEYCEENKKIISQRNKKKYEENKEKIKERVKNYYEKNKEKRIQKTKEYREKNKELIKQYQKEYREKQKNKKIFNSVLLECMETIEDIKDDNNWRIRLDHKEYDDIMYKFKKYASDNTKKAKYHLETTANKTPLCNDVLKIVIGYL